MIKQNLNVEKTEAAVEEKIGQHPSREPYRKRNTVFQNVRAFAHTIHQAVETMQAAGISADAQKLQSDTHIEYRIRIPVPQRLAGSEQLHQSTRCMICWKRSHKNSWKNQSS